MRKNETLRLQIDRIHDRSQDLKKFKIERNICGAKISEKREKDCTLINGGRD